uniref:N-acetyltaurine hydrolase n=1 Tax=Oncorhynchus tshawytscha TaxID=74940 RepID=A0A8C8JD68_ONCTS
MWEDIWRYAETISICNRTRAIQLRIIHRLHISPNRRHAFSPTSSSPQCLKCKTDTGTLTYCLWSCTKIQRYWSGVLQEIENILGVDLELDPVSLLLGLPSRHVTSVGKRRLYNILTFAARKNILLQWISDKVPSIKDWHKILFEWMLEFMLNYAYNLEYNLFGTEMLNYAYNLEVDMPSDSQRVKLVAFLVQEGYEDNIVIAHDIHTKNRLTKYGGQDYSHILKNIVAKMLSRVINQTQVDKALIENSKRWLTFK